MKYSVYGFLLFALLIPTTVFGAALTSVRDLISTSIKNVPATHQIEFTATNGIPASGRIVITLDPGDFSIPGTFDYTDVDVSVSSGGPYNDRTLAPGASATEDGVSVVSGSSGSITIILNNTSGVAAGNGVRILLGTNAIFGEAGDVSIINPSSTGSYRVSLETQTALAVRIDDAGTRIAIVEPVSVDTAVELTPPIRSNGLPSGVLAHGNSVIELSLNTNEISTCRYATSTNVLYSAMTETFTAIGGTLHTKVVTGHVDDTAYAYYVRCIDTDGTENTDDYAITFSLEDTPDILVSTGQTSNPNPGPSGGGGGSGGVPGGSTSLFLANVTLSGFTTPNGDVRVLRDGVETARAQAGADGRFQAIAANLERGTYTFGAYVIDRQARKSSTFSSTLTVGQGTNNNFSNIILPPTIALSSDTVALGAPATVSGEGVPGSVIEVYLRKDGTSIPLEPSFTTRASQGTPGQSDGLWTVEIPASALSQGTFEIRALAVSTQGSESARSAAAFLGVGEDPNPDFSLRSDINGDDKVNLVDFSILLTVWGRADDRADMNLDGTVNLADFSILLFNWTG